ncbi:MAG: ogr/Delta-like zinc finger family protein [Desulforhopalus sp.]
MRVRCNRCEKLATIQSSSQESDSVKKMYCTCSNPMCGHTFVMELVFSHTLSPSALDLPEQLIAKIMQLTRVEQQRIFSSLSI